jgi:hypothetical protein
MKGAAMKKLLASTVVLGAVSGGAYATSTTFNLDQISCPSIGTGTLGTVTLTQNGANEVDVSVVLAADAAFVDTGNHFAIAFNVNVSGISTVVTGSMVGLMRPLITNASDPPYGSFGYGLECSGCGPGSSHANPGPLTFEVRDASGISVSNFVANGTLPGYYFAADLIGPAGGSGSIASKGPSQSVAMPEPVSMALLGAGIFGIGMIRRHRQPPENLLRSTDTLRTDPSETHVSEER